MKLLRYTLEELKQFSSDKYIDAEMLRATARYAIDELAKDQPILANEYAGLIAQHQTRASFYAALFRRHLSNSPGSTTGVWDTFPTAFQDKLLASDYPDGLARTSFLLDCYHFVPADRAALWMSKNPEMLPQCFAALSRTITSFENPTSMSFLVASKCVVHTGPNPPIRMFTIVGLLTHGTSPQGIAAAYPRCRSNLETIYERCESGFNELTNIHNRDLVEIQLLTPLRTLMREIARHYVRQQTQQRPEQARRHG